MAANESEVHRQTRLLFETKQACSVKDLELEPSKEDVARCLLLVARRITDDANSGWHKEAAVWLMWEAVAYEVDIDSLPLCCGKILLNVAYLFLQDLRNFSPQTDDNSINDNSMSLDSPPRSPNSGPKDNNESPLQSVWQAEWPDPWTAEEIKDTNAAIIDGTQDLYPDTLVLADSVTVQDVLECLEKAIQPIIAERVRLMEQCSATSDFDHTSQDYNDYIFDFDAWSAILNDDMACVRGLGRGILWALLSRAWEDIYLPRAAAADLEIDPDYYERMKSSAGHDD